MKKNKVVYSFFACVLIVILTLSSCSSDIDMFEGADGVQHKIVRDAKRNIILNENGELAVYVTNENGKIRKDDRGEKMTEYIEFNGQLYDEGKVESRVLSFVLPKGFKAIKDTPDYFEYEDGKGQIFVGNSESISSDESIKSILLQCKMMQDEYGADMFTYEQSTLEAKNVELKVVKVRSIAADYNKNVSYYYIDYGNGYYRFNCISDGTLSKEINFDRFAKSIELKQK